MKRKKGIRGKTGKRHQKGNPNNDWKNKKGMK